jgi:hypothetical protein
MPGSPWEFIGFLSEAVLLRGAITILKNRQCQARIHKPWSIIIWLMVLTILKNMKVHGKDDIPYIRKNKKCLKPPTSVKNCVAKSVLR